MSNNELKVVFPHLIPQEEIDNIVSLLKQLRTLFNNNTFPQATVAMALFISTTCETLGSNPSDILDFIKSFIELQEEKEEIDDE